MLMTDQSILGAINKDELVINPMVSDQLQPASVDLRLAWPWTSPNTSFAFRPGDFQLYATLEHIELPDWIAGEIRGKSSLARQGLSVSFSGFIDPGFRGNITLQCFNASGRQIQLSKHMKICQLLLHDLRPQRVLRPYGSEGLGSRYQDSKGVQL